MRRRWMGVTATAVAALTLGAAACGGDDQSVADAEANMCSSLKSFATAVVDLKQVNPGNTKEDLQSAADNVKSAWDDVKSSAQDVKSADTAALDSAQSSLQSGVQDLPDDTTVADGLKQLQPELQEVNSTLEEISNGLNCLVSAATDTGASG